MNRIRCQLPIEFRHLEPSLLLVGPRAMCIHRSAALVLDLPHSDLVFGTLRAATPEEQQMIGPEASTTPFIHCWVELGEDILFAPTTIERCNGSLLPMRRQHYYEMNGVRDVRRLSRKDVLRISGEIGLSAHLRKGVPAKKSVGATLLDAAGVRWKLSADEGIIPADLEDA
jgi:hypothetical protein